MPLDNTVIVQSFLCLVSSPFFKTAGALAILDISERKSRHAKHGVVFEAIPTKSTAGLSLSAEVAACSKVIVSLPDALLER